MRSEILKRLKDADGFVSGEALGKAAGVTRAALWKHIKAMKDDGAVIDSTTGRGYRLKSAPQVPRAEYISAYAQTQADISFKKLTFSTNDDARDAARNKDISRAVFIADAQEGGRGRMGRVWVSQPGGLYMSFLVRPNIGPEQIPALTLMAAVVVCEAVEKMAALTVRIKWPNDVILGDRKLAGILTESMMGMDGAEYVVCGIGVNTGERVSADIADLASRIDVNRTLLAAAVIDGFFDGYDRFVREGIAPFMQRFRERNALSGSITIHSANGSETGEFLGFDDTGAILLDCAGGKKRFIAGEVSARGERNYV